LLKSNNSLVADIIFGEPKDYQAKEEKMLAEAPSYTIHRQTLFELASNLIWKGDEEGR
jgi:hypothetical protein